jgi:hypothetical protein
MNRVLIIVCASLALAMSGSAQNQQSWFSGPSLLALKRPSAVASSSTLGVGLVAHYLLNDNAASKTILDNKGSYNGSSSVSNTAALTRTGKINGAIDTCATDYLYADGLAGWCNGKTSLTLSVWLKTTENSTYGNGAVVAGWSYYNSCALLLYNHKFKIQISATGSPVATSTNSIDDGAWHHLTATYNATVAKVFIDGALQGTSTSGSGAVNCSDGFAIGIYKNGGSVDQNGQQSGWFDDVRVYSRVLTDAEILELYNSGNGTEGE